MTVQCLNQENEAHVETLYIEPGTVVPLHHLKTVHARQKVSNFHQYFTLLSYSQNVGNNGSVVRVVRLIASEHIPISEA